MSATCRCGLLKGGDDVMTAIGNDGNIAIKKVSNLLHPMDDFVCVAHKVLLPPFVCDFSVN